MGKILVFCDDLQVKFEVDDISIIHKAMKNLNYRMVCGMENYVSVMDFIDELNLDESYYDLKRDIWGWNIMQTGVIEYDLWPGIIDDKPAFELRFVTLPIRDFLTGINYEELRQKCLGSFVFIPECK